MANAETLLSRVQDSSIFIVANQGKPIQVASDANPFSGSVHHVDNADANTHLLSRRKDYPSFAEALAFFRRLECQAELAPDSRGKGAYPKIAMQRDFPHNTCLDAPADCHVTSRTAEVDALLPGEALQVVAKRPFSAEKPHGENSYEPESQGNDAYCALEYLGHYFGTAPKDIEPFARGQVLYGRWHGVLDAPETFSEVAHLARSVDEKTAHSTVDHMAKISSDESEDSVTRVRAKYMAEFIATVRGCEPKISRSQMHQHSTPSPQVDLQKREYGLLHGAGDATPRSLGTNSIGIVQIVSDQSFGPIAKNSLGNAALESTLPRLPKRKNGPDKDSFIRRHVKPLNDNPDNPEYITTFLKQIQARFVMPQRRRS
ncbi:hypothetical protein [Pandoraea pulmonicola]|uniref:hypothetical protein n=1 Tax=Pandoraea pulmonicola TaxID=93221 RepID=UPI0011C066B6|nr:hypothetical protein [Pandoraea pulmonicola]